MRNIDYPNTKDVIAMVSKLEYSEKYDTALRYIFGRTLICRNLEIATQLRHLGWGSGIVQGQPYRRILQ